MAGPSGPGCDEQEPDAIERAVEHRIGVRVRARLRSGAGAWSDRSLLVIPMCDHDPPRLGVLVTAVADLSGEEPPGLLGAHVQHAAVEARAADALDVLTGLTTQSDLPHLSARQVEILARLVRGESADDIAAALFLSSSTVRNHLSALYRKFGVHSRAALLAELLRTSAPRP